MFKFKLSASLLKYCLLVVRLMWSACALSSFAAFFNSDSHKLISQEGLKYLEDSNRLKSDR